MTLFAVLVLALPFAQEAQVPREGFFKRDAVDFFGNKPKSKVVVKPGGAESIWAEPVRSGDGSVSIYVPPKQVVDFLDNPSEENARKYLAWKRERLTKMRAAMEALKKVSSEATPERETDQSKAVPPQPPAPAPEVRAPQLLYFKKADCRYCEYQDVVLADLAKRHSNWKVTTIGVDDKDLWKKHSVTATPTLVVIGDEGTAAKTLRGLAFVEAIETAVRESAPKPKGDSNEKRDR